MKYFSPKRARITKQDEKESPEKLKSSSNPQNKTIPDAKGSTIDKNNLAIETYKLQDPESKQAAIKLFTEAAEEGSDIAATNLACCYYDGDGCCIHLGKSSEEPTLNPEEKKQVIATKCIFIFKSSGDYKFYFIDQQKIVKQVNLPHTTLLSSDSKKKRSDSEQVNEFSNLSLMLDSYEFGYLEDLIIREEVFTFIKFHKGNSQINYAEAFKYFKKAADQNNTAAQYHLALCYYLGQGVKQDTSLANILFQYTLFHDLNASNEGFSADEENDDTRLIKEAIHFVAKKIFSSTVPNSLKLARQLFMKIFKIESSLLYIFLIDLIDCEEENLQKKIIELKKFAEKIEYADQLYNFIISSVSDINVLLILKKLGIENSKAQKLYAQFVKIQDRNTQSSMDSADNKQNRDKPSGENDENKEQNNYPLLRRKSSSNLVKLVHAKKQHAKKPVKVHILGIEETAKRWINGLLHYKVGQQGESLVFNRLIEHYMKKLNSAQKNVVRVCDSLQAKIKGERHDSKKHYHATIQITWLNAFKENGQPYDIILNKRKIFHSGKNTSEQCFIEVKSTKRKISDAPDIIMSDKQWEFFMKNRSRLFIATAINILQKDQSQAEVFKINPEKAHVKQRILKNTQSIYKISIRKDSDQSETVLDFTDDSDSINDQSLIR